MFALDPSSLTGSRFYKTYIPNETIGAVVSHMEKEHSCSSCGTRLIDKGTVVFNCPNCDTGKIGRCAHCRDQSVPYICPECGYEGP